MTLPRRPRAWLRRFSVSGVVRLFSLLVAVTLPLHGIADAMASIEAPAHIHPAVSTQPVAPPRASVPSQQDVFEKGVLEEAVLLVDVADEPQHAPAIDGHHRHGVVEHPTHASHGGAHADDHAALREDHPQASPVRPPAAVVGHHRHGFEEVNVVYLGGDPERPDLGAAKHAPAGAEAALPTWSMPLLARLKPPVLPQAVSDFRSRGDMPLLRPPSFIGFAPT